MQNGSKLAGLEMDLDLPSSDVYDWELILGLERGHLKVYKNVKIQDLSYNSILIKVNKTE